VSRGVVPAAYGFPRPEAPSAEDACVWTVTYDTWINSFDVGEYEPVTQGGLHCLVACCADPTCLGLAMESNERYQCYKYSTLPEELSNYEHRALGDSSWLVQRPNKWSVFVKRVRPGFQQIQPPPAGAISSVSQESDLDQTLRHLQAMSMPQQGHCEWMVHYDRWIETFDALEYEGVERGGAHCLEVCCKDPSCLGLAMESSEMYQCYKYSKLPTGLLAGNQPRNLSNGVWLLDLKPAWSIFIKAGPAWQAAPQARALRLQARPSRAVSAQPAADAVLGRSGSPRPEAIAIAWPWRVLQVLFITLFFFLAHRVANSHLGDWLARGTRRGASGPEGTKLIGTALTKVPL